MIISFLRCQAKYCTQAEDSLQSVKHGCTSSLKHCTGLRTQERHIHDLHLCRQALRQWPKFGEVGLWGCCLHRKLYSGQCSTAAISWAHVLAIRQNPKTE